MAIKNALLPVQIISAGDMSANITGPVTTVAYLDSVAIQLNFTGTPTGTFEIQGSLDHKVSVPANSVVSNGNWVAMTLTPIPTATGSAGQILINMNQIAFPYIRIVYLFASGTGSLDAYIAAKEI